MKSYNPSTLCMFSVGALALMACDDTRYAQGEVAFVVPVAPEVRTTALHPGPCVIENDEGIDGTIDREIYLTYDSAGREVMMRYYSDGEEVQAYERKYDEAGNEVEYVFARYGDEPYYLYFGLFSPYFAPDTSMRSTYDEQNRLIRRTFDKDNDGQPILVDVHTYDEDGQLISVVGTWDDGRVSTTTYTYSEDGALIWSSGETELSDGRIENCSQVFNNPVLRLRDTLSDTNCDGIPESTIQTTYDENGAMVLSTRDDNGDGAVEFRITVERDEQERVEHVLYEYINPEDGSVSSSYSTTTTFAALWWPPLEMQLDIGNDGVIDSTETHTYDRFGNPLTSLSRQLSDKSIPFGHDSWVVYRYDCFEDEAASP